LRRFDARLVALALVLWPVLSNPVPGAVTTTGEVRQPRNIYELVYAFNHTFRAILNDEEMQLVSTRSPEEIRELNPELYQRISQNVTGWTDEWLQSVKPAIETIPDKRLDSARLVGDQVDALLRAHFEWRKWPYRRMRVVFLPPRLFLDERKRENLTSGMFIPFYPEVFFASIDWPVPIETILVHESLHFNKTGRRYGRPLSEGITEVGTRYLLLKYGLLTAPAINRVPAYESERKGVDLVLDEIMKRTGGSREDATDLFLEAYLTGHQDVMNKLLGNETWESVLRLSQSERDWQTHKIKKALGY